MQSGSYSLADVRADRVIVECKTCKRRGEYSTTRLIETYGRDISLPDLRRRLVVCTVGEMGSCQARFAAETVKSWLGDNGV